MIFLKLLFNIIFVIFHKQINTNLVEMDEVCVSHLSDIEIAEKMRRSNYEKFKTLVRMHLSFQLDLNTDEFDLPCHEVIYYEKGKLKKWNRLSKKMKSCTSGKANASPPETNRPLLDHNFIKQLRNLKMFILMEENVIQEGIFRKTGSASRQNELRSLIQSEQQLDLTKGYSVHDCATVFKSFLAELHEPVLTDAHYPAHSQIAPLCNALPPPVTAIVDKKKEQHILNSMQLLLLLLPHENRTLLQDIIEMLHIVSNHANQNKMSSENLATLFAPHLICPRNLPPEALHYVAQTMCAIITYMITKGLVVFEIPAKLATDIRAYFLERKRKKTMSPEQTLDESISDMSTVNTVYTFVDREKTAAAQGSNNTDTELAQLYAHIQTLPESSKKRRLIKQFNKQNGQGTPLQLVTLNRIKHSEPTRSAKSISDSIKKHIFHKGIISRTPKRTPVTLNSQGTPSFATKNPKLRVLFQSPISNIPFHSNSGTPSNSSSPSTSSNLFSIKTHPLKKSISSSSLLLTNSMTSRQDHTSSSSLSSNSAPVSRTTSSELEEAYCTTPLKIEDTYGKTTSTPVPSILETKSVLWKYTTLEEDDEDTSNPSTPINKQNHSRYKSEPNLSRIIKEHKELPIAKSKSLTRKLIKGVSMGNLRLPFANNDSSKRFGRSAFSLRRDVSDESGTFQEETESDYELEKPMQEEEVEEEGHEGDEDNNTIEMPTSHLSYYRNLELITSTPSMMLERRSMSPITKSTQRMPKSMQESIMTPRSRKPVMLTTTQGSSEQNQTFYQSDLSSFREQDEDSAAGQISCGPQQTFSGNKRQDIEKDTRDGALSNHFKDYLLSRSVLTASPVDSSFFSQTDDYGSTQDIEDLEESQLSTSLLYCLDGNRPVELEEEEDEVNLPTSSTNSVSRKRAACSDENKENTVSKKENFLVTKKLYISEITGNATGGQGGVGSETSI
ncbi:rho GTPase-activating protein gacII [Eupeodes corollae]|uniref:rho GTPase-activating protein gacII n=1 Tax=Eupeodes corollae TaxID=290404 RepID=UPI0024931BE3|nr:rho GTPase-activating protein gacII [Eupeodes corollae]